MYTPSWYDAKDCGVLRLPNLDRAASTGVEFGKKEGIPKCQKWQNDTESVILSVIDCQVDFVCPDGTLAVPGAIDDTDRLNRFIYANPRKLSHILASLDSHYLFQVFHRFNWIAGSHPTSRVNGVSYFEGEHPGPFTVITLQDVKDDVWRPVRHPKEMMRYLGELEQTHKKQLCIWPLHCILGTPGHAWDSSFAEAMVFHAAARGNQYDATTKGMSPLSEHFGILKAEVDFPDDPNTQLNTRVLAKWEQADRIFLAGQAKSHCVLATLEQIVSNFQAQSKAHLLTKLFVLRDCMSSVPDIALPDGTTTEFDRMAEDRFKDFEQLGVQFVNSTDPI